MKIILLSFLCLNLFANEEHSASNKAEAPKADLVLEGKPSDDMVDFNSIRDLIKKDGLQDELKKKEDAAKKKSELKARIDRERFHIPNKENFWPFFFETWLVRNAPKLKWDFQKPDMGIEDSYQAFLGGLGFFETKFKILLLDSTEIYRMSFFGANGEVVHLISLPLLRSLDLSKVEISILLFEDFLRLRKGYLISKLENKDLNTILGSNFSGKPFPKDIFDNSYRLANDYLFSKGFSFQEQFEVTKEMDQLLKSDMKMWNTYYTLLGKIDQLAKTNALYKRYADIYPSPEMQMSWLVPKSKYP